MFGQLITVLSTSLVLAIGPTSFLLPGSAEAASWKPVAGDKLLVDTQNNMGYLIHPDGMYISFRVVTGQRRNVWYIGRFYNATTPKWDWDVESMDIKGDHVTFGPTGRFLRLYKDDERTAYGIHGHRDADEMLAESARFRSMGCIIVSEAILDLIQRTYENNGGALAVKTQAGDPMAEPMSTTVAQKLEGLE